MSPSAPRPHPPACSGSRRQQAAGSRQQAAGGGGQLRGSVVWVCLRFCDRELRFISLKHAISRHPAICSEPLKTNLVWCLWHLAGSSPPARPQPAPAALLPCQEGSWSLIPRKSPQEGPGVHTVCPHAEKATGSGSSVASGPHCQARSRALTQTQAGPSTWLPLSSGAPYKVWGPWQEAGAWRCCQRTTCGLAS